MDIDVTITGNYEEQNRILHEWYKQRHTWIVLHNDWLSRDIEYQQHKYDEKYKASDGGWINPMEPEPKLPRCELILTYEGESGFVYQVNAASLGSEDIPRKLRIRVEFPEACCSIL